MNQTTSGRPVRITVVHHPSKRGFSLMHNQPLGWRGYSQRFGFYQHRDQAAQRADELMGFYNS